MTDYKIFDEIRYFQRYELHEEALEIAEKLNKDELDASGKVKLYKLMALSYRKIGDINLALFCINQAIAIVKREKKVRNDAVLDKELAICLMNKGVIYDSERQYDQACSAYKDAIAIFRTRHDLDNETMSNALLNYGEALFNAGFQERALFTLYEAHSLIRDPDNPKIKYIDDLINKIKGEK